MTSIVVVIGSVPSQLRLSGLASEASILQRLIHDAADVPAVTLLSLGIGRTIDGLETRVDLDSASRPFLDRLLHAIGAYRLRSWLATFPIGRLLNSMGPVDQGRVFWRLVRRSPEALDALRHADVAIAADQAGVKTAWLALRRKWVDAAHYDHRATGLGVTIVIPSRSDDTITE